MPPLPLELVGGWPPTAGPPAGATAGVPLATGAGAPDATPTPPPLPKFDNMLPIIKTWTEY